MAQRTVSGTVTSADGEPLIGVNVLILGSSTGTVTDFDGKYTVEVPDQASLPPDHPIFRGEPR